MDKVNPRIIVVNSQRAFAVRVTVVVPCVCVCVCACVHAYMCACVCLFVGTNGFAAMQKKIFNHGFR